MRNFLQTHQVFKSTLGNRTTDDQQIYLVMIANVRLKKLHFEMRIMWMMWKMLALKWLSKKKWSTMYAKLMPLICDMVLFEVKACDPNKNEKHRPPTLHTSDQLPKCSFPDVIFFWTNQHFWVHFCKLLVSKRFQFVF